MGKLLTIAVNEMRAFRRDHCTWGVVGIYVAVLASSCIASTLTWSRQVTRQSTLQRQAREEWLTQKSDSPHQATHRGTRVYKLPSPLAGFDPGVASEFGTVVRLESHQRHRATHSSNGDTLSFLQLNFTTPALLMQAILPLVVIVLSHSMVARERELGTWGLLASLGVSPRQAVTGKSMAVFCLAVWLTTPVLLGLLWVVITYPAETGMTFLDVAARAAAIYAVNLLYLAGWCAAGTALSARCSSGASLILLLSCWVAWTLVIPRLAVDMAYSRFALPSHESLLEARMRALREGSDGRSSLQAFNAALEKRLLQEYGVTELQDLPIDLNAARLLALEEFTNSIDDYAHSRLESIYAKQNRFLDWFEVVSPYLAIRSLSSSFAGTDRHHHDAFMASTESYRRLLVRTMNRAEMMGERPGPIPGSARRFWKRVPAFQQGFPALVEVFYEMRWTIAVFVFWFLIMLMLTLTSPKGMVA